MIEFRSLPDEHASLKHSPLLRAAQLTLRYVAENGPIGLTKTKAFRRTFVHWAAENFDWPGRGYEEIFRYNKVLNEHEFPPLLTLHFLLTALKLGRHYRGEFRLTQRGRDVAKSLGELFAEMIPFYILKVDHSSYARLDGRPSGNWNVWLNVINVEIDHGATERRIFGALYGEGPDWDNEGWRAMAVFSTFVMLPLEWAGLVVVKEIKREERTERLYFKTPLWRSALKLDTDRTLTPATVH